MDCDSLSYYQQFSTAFPPEEPFVHDPALGGVLVTCLLCGHRWWYSLKFEVQVERAIKQIRKHTHDKRSSE